MFCQGCWWSRDMAVAEFTIKKGSLNWDFPLLCWIVFDRLCCGTMPFHWQLEPPLMLLHLLFISILLADFILLICQSETSEKRVVSSLEHWDVYIVFSKKYKTKIHVCYVTVQYSYTYSMTGGYIFYMFILFTSMLGVLLKCCTAAYIQALRLESDMLGHLSHYLPSFIIVCSSVSLCLLLSCPSISILSLILNRAALLLLASPLCDPPTP